MKSCRGLVALQCVVYGMHASHGHPPQTAVFVSPGNEQASQPLENLPMGRRGLSASFSHALPPITSNVRASRFGGRASRVWFFPHSYSGLGGALQIITVHARVQVQIRSWVRGRVGREGSRDPQLWSVLEPSSVFLLPSYNTCTHSHVQWLSLSIDNQDEGEFRAWIQPQCWCSLCSSGAPLRLSCHSSRLPRRSPRPEPSSRTCQSRTRSRKSKRGTHPFQLRQGQLGPNGLLPPVPDQSALCEQSERARFTGVSI